MEEKKKKIVNTNLGILLICLFSSIFTMADFLIIDHVLDKYFDYSKCECSKCGDNNLKLDDNKENKTVNDNGNNDGNVNGTNNNSVSNVFPNSYLNCIEQNGKYCLVRNDADLKVEVEIDSEHNYVLIVNGNSFLPDVEDYHAAITDLQFLNDGYIYVQFGIQGLGPMDKAYILDSSGNVVSKSNDIDYILNDGNYDRDAASIKFENNKLFLSNTVFADGGLGVICSNKKFNTGWWPEYDQIVYVEFNYEYAGNGKLNEVNHTYKTFSEKLNETYGVNTCEELNR